MCQKETNCVLRENTTPSMMGEIVLPPPNVDSIVPADSGNQEICRPRACYYGIHRSKVPPQVPCGRSQSAHPEVALSFYSQTYRELHREQLFSLLRMLYRETQVTMDIGSPVLFLFRERARSERFEYFDIILRPLRRCLGIVGHSSGLYRSLWAVSDRSAHQSCRWPLARSAWFPLEPLCSLDC